MMLAGPGLSAKTIQALQRAGIELGEPSSGPIGQPGRGEHGGSAEGDCGAQAWAQAPECNPAQFQPRAA